MNNCSRCETFPDNPTGTFKIFLSTPLEHTLSKLANIFDDNSHPYSIQDNSIIYSKLSVNGLRELQGVIREQLSNDEINDVKALWKNTGEGLSLSDLTEMQPLDSLLAQLESEWLIDVLENDRLYNVFQPIVVANEPETVHGYECLIRATNQDGDTIGPGEIFPTAKKSDMLFQLDRDARIAAVNNSTNIPVEKKIFINFMPTSIYDPEYCLRTTMEAVQENEIRTDQLVFEVVETEQIHDRENLLDILQYYRKEGINVALDDLGSGYSSLNLLADLEPDYVKLDLELVQSVHEQAFKAELAESIINTATKNGIMTLAEGIETKADYKWFRNSNVDYMQGYYFAKPDKELVDSISLQS